MHSFSLRRRALAVTLALGLCPGVALAQPPALELLVLGSGGPGAAGRAGSAYVVLVDGVARVFVDAGPGSFVRLGEAGLALGRADIVLLTHLHVDHAGELPGLAKARALGGHGPVAFRIFGPAGRRAARAGAGGFPATSRFVELLFGQGGAFAYLKDFAAPLSFRVTDVTGARTVHADGGLRISAAPGHHGDAPSVIYRIDYRGKSIVFSGDIDAAGLPALRGIAKGCDLLVFNSVVLDPPGSREILYTLHTPPKAIGEVAAASGAGRLLLSHLSPFLDSHRQAVSASVAASYGGPLVFAEDGMRLAP